VLQPSPARRLRELLDGPDLLQMPGCFDAMSARLIEQAGFPLGFMSGFAVSASHLAGPDTGLMSLGEMLDRGREICAAVSIPMIGDGDTGFGNAVSVRRTVHGYARAGFACVMIEDQVAPKRCGHTEGKQVVPRDEDEMRVYCEAVPGPKMANMIEHGVTPVLPPARLEAIGYRIAVYPLTQLSAAIRAMRESLEQIRGEGEARNVLEFSELTDTVGFPAYHRLAERYSD